jgi:Mg-chelatase subunit ChlD
MFLGAGKLRRLVLLFVAVLLVNANCQEKPSVHEVVIAAADKHGNPVAVSQGMLHASLDGEPLELESISSAKDRPLVFAVMLDITGSMRDKEIFSKDVSRSIFKALTDKGGVGYFGVFGKRIEVSSAPVTLDRVNQIISPKGMEGRIPVAAAVKEASTHALSRNSNPGTLRRVLVLVTDGDDNATKQDMDEAIEAAQREGVSVAVLGLMGIQDTKKAKEKLRMFSSETPGTIVLLDGPGEYMRKLMPYFDEQFVLSFRDSTHSDGKLHALNVSTGTRDLQISAPQKVVVR